MAFNISVFLAIMPVLIGQFGSSVGYVQSILVLFSLVTASFAPTAENICHYFGRTKIFCFGLVLYGVGIAATALSPTMAWVAVNFIVLCGLGATVLVSTPWAIADLTSGGRVDSRTALVLTFAAAAGGSGGVIGGFLAEQLGWRWSFAPSLIVLFAILVLARRLPQVDAFRQQPLDWFGGLLSFLGFGLVLVGVSLGGEFGWWMPRREFSVAGVVLPPFAVSIVPALIGTGAIILGLFAYRQRSHARQSRLSIVRAGLLRRPVFVLATIVAMLHTLVTAGVQFNLYQFLPIAAEFGPFRTALAIVPYWTALALVPLAAKRFGLHNRFVPKQLVFAGLGVVAAGILVLYASARNDVQPLELLPGLAIMGSGSGLFLSAAVTLAYSVAARDERPEGSAIFNPMQNLGSSLGRALLGTMLVLAASRSVVDGIAAVFGHSFSADDRRRSIFALQELIQTMPRHDVVAAVLARMPPGSQSALHAIELQAAAAGMRAALLVSFVTIAFCVLLAALLPALAARQGEI